MNETTRPWNVDGALREEHQMAIGTCRREGCEKPRRVRRGAVEPLCEDCYRQALRRVATQLSGEEAPGAARKRFQRTPAKANKPESRARTPRREPVEKAA